jgi:glycosyltransferase involved in cell wall biosynthesis
MSEPRPKVTVLTPVYNGEAYIAECVESVMHQSYANWEYIIVNNCSVDKTLEVVTRYANQDRRIRIIDNASFVDVIENHNIAFSFLPPDSKYCKVVSADDWLYRECLERMVDVAERNPSVGMVSCYTIANTSPPLLRQGAMPLRQEVFSGREVCRWHLLGTDVLGAPTSVFYRADVIRNTRPFFAVAAPSADIHASFSVLQNHDYGFVHQILCFERWHELSVSSKLVAFNSFLVDRIHFVIAYGHTFLTPNECCTRLNQLFSRYYAFLADQAIHSAGPAFWRYHRAKLAALGYPINMLRVAGLVGLRVLDWFGNPKRSLEKILSRLSA